jgi:SAM-dependent methyltransferase
MQANTNRAGRFNFDSIAGAYDEARLSIPVELIADASAAAGFRAGGRALEVGAGTGQLTVGLLDQGWDVTAIEPGARMRDLLADKLGAGVLLLADPFEDFEPDGSYDTVWSANAFHWVDPAVSYDKAADAMRPAGRLVLVWTFTMAADDVQERLNEEVFRADWPGLVRETDGASSTDVLVGAGADECAASGRFDRPEIRRRTYHHQLSADQYTKLQLTFGDMTALTAADRASLAAGIRSVAAEFAVLNVAYTCVAARTRPSGYPG